MAKGLKDEIGSIKTDNAKFHARFIQDSTEVATASQLRILSTTVTTQMDIVEAKIDTLSSRINTVEASLQQILSLLTYPIDVKKGEKVIKTKCTPDLVVRKDDDTS